MSSINRRKSLRRQRQDLLGKSLLLLMVLVGSGGLWGYHQLKQEYVQRESQSLCRVDGFVSRETVLIVDTTDSLSKSQSLLVKAEIEQLLSSALTDERISLYVITDKALESSEQLSMCNPGDGQDKSELIANKRRLQQQWQRFYSRLMSEVDLLLADRNASRSPILETIQYVAARTLTHSEAAQKRLILASDMLQHSQQISHYRAGGTSLQTPYLRQLIPELDRVAVEILYVTRPTSRQHPGHLRFWQSYFRLAHGQVTRIERVN